MPEQKQPDIISSFFPQRKVYTGMSPSRSSYAQESYNFDIVVSRTRYMHECIRVEDSRILLEHPVRSFLIDVTHKHRQSENHEKLSLKRSVNELLKTAGHANWDGENALPVTPGTAQLAKKLVNLFPEFIEPPDVSASPHGEIDFEWFVSKDAMLTVSVCPSEEIAFAGLFNGSEIHGEEPWNEGDLLPHLIHICFDMLQKSVTSETE